MGRSQECFRPCTFFPRSSSPAVTCAVAGNHVFSLSVTSASSRRPQWSVDQAQEFASLLDLANDAILVLDLPGAIEFWNQGAERLYGWSAAQAIGRNAHE